MPNKTDVRVFIASSDELVKERKECALVLADLSNKNEHLHLRPVMFEMAVPAGSYPTNEELQNKINPLIDTSDIVVVFFWSRVGRFTKMEFDRAMQQNKKLFLLFRKFTPDSDEPEVLIQYAEVLKLRKELKLTTGIISRTYENENEFYTTLFRDLGNYIAETYPQQETQPSKLTSTSYQHIPLAPRPYLAHPYALPRNFTGRTEEMRLLTEWLKFDKEPMCIVEAIGGMGKSAMTWKWLQHEVIDTNLPVEGIVWWSFYDQGFEDFIHHLYEYCVPQAVRDQRQSKDELTEVITALANHQFLLVLDGFERVLRGYAQMMAMYIQEQGLTQKKFEAAVKEFDVQQRTPITPKAEKLLRALCAGKTKTLMTTRQSPATIEG